MFTKRKHLGRRPAIAVAIGVACCAVALAAKPVKPAYTIMPFYVTVPPEGYQSQASWVYDLNEAGRAVGFERFQKEDGSGEETCWGLYMDAKAPGCTPVRVPGAYGATGINNLNQIVGNKTTFEGAFWRDPADSDPVSLPPLLGDTLSEPYAINDAGMVVGHSLWIQDGGQTILSRAVAWRVVVDGGGTVSVRGPVALPLLEGATQAWALALSEWSNGSFHVTGVSVSQDGPDEAVVWTIAFDGESGTLTPGPAASLVGNHAYNSSGNGVNLDGDACGHVDYMPFVAPAGQTAQLLPVPPYTVSGVAHRINNLSQIVGYVEIKTKPWFSEKNGYFAYLWKEDGSAINLTTKIDPAAGWARLWEATAINDAGVIGGTGYRNAQWRGFVLIPIEQQ